jgi:tetraacyldisaccharide 4'-kinase
MNPLTTIYGAAGALRNSLFDLGVLPTRGLDRPVVSVGNLSVGGTGKTPLVIALGEMLKARGIRFDVLSRGYRRRTRGVLVVEPDGSPDDFGDEPLLIAKRLEVPVIVGESRYEAGKVAERAFQSQLHILDDGFQHRSLARDFDIVLLTHRDLHDRLLPLGRLREPLASLARADAVVVPTDVLSPNPAEGHDVLRGKLVWRMKRQIVIPLKLRAPVVFCGIAQPQQFFEHARAQGIKPAAEIAFRDHHRYNAHDIRRLHAARDQHDSDGFITTEKDVVNLGPLQRELDPLAVARLGVSFDDPAGMTETILGRIDVSAARS